MKAYHVFSWAGEYEQYDEYDHKYFLNEQKAREYEEKLGKEQEQIRIKNRLPNGYDMYHGGSVFEEIEIEN